MKRLGAIADVICAHSVGSRFSGHVLGRHTMISSAVFTSKFLKLAQFPIPSSAGHMAQEPLYLE